MVKDTRPEEVKRLRDAVRRKRPDKWATNDWFISPDSSPSHRTLIEKNYLARQTIITLEKSPYFPDLAQVDLYLFPRLKIKLKRRRTVDSDDMNENAMKLLKDISQYGTQQCNAGRSVCMQTESTLKKK